MMISSKKETAKCLCIDIAGLIFVLLLFCLLIGYGFRQSSLISTSEEYAALTTDTRTAETAVFYYNNTATHLPDNSFANRGKQWFEVQIFQSSGARENRDLVLKYPEPFYATITSLFAQLLKENVEHATYKSIGNTFMANKEIKLQNSYAPIKDLHVYAALVGDGQDVMRTLKPVLVLFNDVAKVTAEGNIYSIESFNCKWFLRDPDYATFKNGGCLVSAKDTTWGKKDALATKDIMCSMYPHKTVHRAITIATMWGDAYWHFPIEALTGLADHDDWLASHEHVFVHVSKATPFVLQWLDLVGITKERVIDGLVQVEQLRAPRLGRCGGAFPYQVAWLQTHIRKTGIKADTNQKRTILLVNRSPFKRALENELGLAQALEYVATEAGLVFDVLQSDNLPSVKDQLRKFAQAQVVVTPHGASAVNLLACETGTAIVEIVDVNFINCCGMELSQTIRLRYYGVMSVEFTVNIYDVVTMVQHALSNIS